MRPSRTTPRADRADREPQRVDEFKARFGPTLVTGFAWIHGIPVGILAINGILSRTVRKRERISSSLLPARNTAGFSSNITGFMVGP